MRTPKVVLLCLCLGLGCEGSAAAATLKATEGVAIVGAGAGTYDFGGWGSPSAAPDNVWRVAGTVGPVNFSQIVVLPGDTWQATLQGSFADAGCEHLRFDAVFISTSACTGSGPNDFSLAFLFTPIAAVLPATLTDPTYSIKVPFLLTGTIERPFNWNGPSIDPTMTFAGTGRLEAEFTRNAAGEYVLTSRKYAVPTPVPLPMLLLSTGLLFGLRLRRR